MAGNPLPLFSLAKRLMPTSLNKLQTHLAWRGNQCSLMPLSLSTTLQFPSFHSQLIVARIAAASKNPRQTRSLKARFGSCVNSQLLLSVQNLTYCLRRTMVRQSFLLVILLVNNSVLTTAIHQPFTYTTKTLLTRHLTTKIVLRRKMKCPSTPPRQALPFLEVSSLDQNFLITACVIHHLPW